jgi:uncharacterized tellurite resistance protein B-like protein
MLQTFRQLLTDLGAGEKNQARFRDNDYRLAAAALLVHATTIDGTISDTERDKLTTIVRERFGLDEEAADELVAAATDAEHEAVDLYRFTSLINRELDDAGRMQIVEMLWQIAYADGRVTEFEDNLIWRAADLLHVSSRARVTLRARVAAMRAGPQ